MSPFKFPLICIVGPTACGKTETAFWFSRLVPGEIISCDSMQVYRDMPILSQAPSRDFQKKIKTHLVSFLDPKLEFNAARFREDTLKLIPQILKKRKVPLIVGGTGLYLRSLLDGLFESGSGLSRDDELRRSLLEEETNAPGILHKKLCQADPDSAEKIHPHDIRRIIRALEVHRLTGKPISKHKTNREGIRNIYDCRIFFIDRDRQELYRRIEQRADEMIKEGLVDEVKALRQKLISKTAQAALGYREIGAYLDGQMTLEKSVELLKQKTRNYAKRQLSWFRHEKGVEVIQALPGEAAEDVAVNIFKAWGKKF